MKKTIIVILAPILALAFVACGIRPNESGLTLENVIAVYTNAGYTVNQDEKPFFQMISAKDGIVFYIDGSPVKVYEFASESDFQKGLDFLAEMKDYPRNGLFVLDTKSQAAIDIFNSLSEQDPVDMTKGTTQPASEEVTTATTQKAVFELGIESAWVTEDMLGQNEIALRVKNNSATETIDAYNFIVACYNAYGEVVMEYGLGDAFFGGMKDQIAIEPGAVDGGPDFRWPLHGFDSGISFEVAIVRYHTVNGDTVEAGDKDSVVRFSVKK